jgi:hypothetical protein
MTPGELIIFLLVAAIVFGVVYAVMHYAEIGQPIRKIVLLILGVVILLYFLGKVGVLSGGPVIKV